jgi:NADH:ubiquinone oxidoreductase subunit C
MNIEAVLGVLREAFPKETLEPRVVPIDETFVTLPPDCIHPAVQLLIECFGLCHLSTITGEDTGSEIVLLYHLWHGRGLTLRAVLPQDGAHIAGATFYEREVSEMLGVTFDGHPDPSTLLLPDDWDGEPPLRQQPGKVR